MDERIVKYQEKMDKTLANLDSEFGTIRAGRANPHVNLMGCIFFSHSFK